MLAANTTDSTSEGKAAGPAVRPGQAEPHRLWSLSDMLQFDPQWWIAITTALHALGANIRLRSDPDPAVRAASSALREFLNGQEEESGNIVSAGYLERRLEHGRDYYEDFSRSASRRPVLDMNDLDSDDMYAFLCAYTTCFRPRETSKTS